ncbi:aldo/keto reductase [Flavihumibacter petaseus]|uniref:Putative oxidoreductase n=1 Tax=Flavihumibacter petaseus NBRC 106054 TaxID=1220578 RepID=A0A0E9MXN7_9BACT|nr:aldo/keto reductase [Flavihumibacter petaseus]GAO42477.1 putative oxidoreductase [Flavihumibacter petaseus NBRC 106054]
MEYRQLGNSSLHISRIGFGAMSLDANPDNVAYLIHQAIAGGINFFDTADIYQHGINETNLGKALAEKRKEVVIASKVGNVWKPDGSGLDWHPEKSHILRSIDDSLRRLKTDYIDLYQLHGGTIQDDIDETIGTFEDLVKSGKIRYYGISSIRPNVIREFIRRSNIISVMMQYSMLDLRPEEHCLRDLHQAGIGVLARGTVAGGLLGGKPPRPYLDHNVETVATVVDAMHRATDKISLGSMAIRFVLENSAITSAIVGVRTTTQLREALNADEIILSKEIYGQLRKSLNPNFYALHRD